MRIRPLVLILASTATIPAVSQFTPGNIPPVADSRDRTPIIAPSTGPQFRTSVQPSLATFVSPPRPATLATAKPICYAIRTYEFSHPDSSEVPKITGTSTCRSAISNQLKAITLSPTEFPRK